MSHHSKVTEMASQSDPTAEYPGSSGASTANDSVLTQPYYQPADPSNVEFKSVVVNIAKQLDVGNRETIYYFHDETLGPDGKSMSGLSILMELEKVGLFHAGDTAKLAKLLEDCGRKDLITKYLEPYCRKFADDLAQQGSQPLDGEDHIETPSLL